MTLWAWNDEAVKLVEQRFLFESTLQVSFYEFSVILVILVLFVDLVIVL